MIRKDDARLGAIMTAGVWICGGGFVVAGIGFFLTVVSGSPSMAALAGLGGVGFVVGLGMIGYVAFSGLHTERSAKNASTAVQIPGSTITARFATNRLGETLFSELDLDFDDPKTKFFVRIQPSEGRQLELRTNSAVWQGCGEGMKGTAVVQGDWLGAFTPTLGSGEGMPYRDAP